MMGRSDTAEPLFHIFCLEVHLRPSIRCAGSTRCWVSVRARGHGQALQWIGRPSIDTQPMIRMLLIGYLQGIRFERRLVEEVHLNLACRWFCRLGLDGRVPSGRAEMRPGYLFWLKN